MEILRLQKSFKITLRAITVFLFAAGLGALVFGALVLYKVIAAAYPDILGGTVIISGILILCLGSYFFNYALKQ